MLCTPPRTAATVPEVASPAATFVRSSSKSSSNVFTGPIVPDRYRRPSSGSPRFHCAGTAYADPMQMIKFTHACVRLIDGESSLLIDPGIWAEAEAFDGVTDVLVTHEHADHVD